MIERDRGSGQPIACIPFGVVYGIRLSDTSEYRYVGQTTKTAESRFNGHKKVAASGRKTPFYDWLRTVDQSSVVVDVLQVIDTSWADLGEAEILWIAGLREDSHRLLNLTDGGLGPLGFVQSPEQRAASAARMTGKKMPPRTAPSPMLGVKFHTDEQKAKWSRARQGSITGELNPNFGKFGKDHPSFGHVMSDESKARLSAQKVGALNPNYGKSPSAETRAKMSAATKGKPMPSSKRNAHTRYHTNKGVFSEKCAYCTEQPSVDLTPLTG